MQPTDTTVSLAVSNDTSKVKDKIQNFIDKFNDVYQYLKNQSIYDGNLKGTLFLDSTATSILNFLRSSATSAVSGIATDKLNSLTKLGITFDNKNGLAISDSTQLENSIKDKADQVEAIFNSVNGIATNLYARVYSYLGAGGYIAKSRNSFGSSIKNLQSNIDSQQKVIDKRSALLRDNYIKMQQQLSSLMNNQSLFSSSGFGG
jgi:flagellar hook-associated protein 2